MPPRSKLVAVGLAAFTALLLLAAAYKLGFGVFALLAAIGLAVLLIGRAELAVGVCVVVVLMCDLEPPQGLGITAQAYEYLPGFKVTALEALLALATAATALQLLARGRIRGLGGLSWPLGILAAGVVAGSITGLSSGVGGTSLLQSLRDLLPLLLLPLLVVQVVDDEAGLRRWLSAAAALAGVKAVLGLLAVGTGPGVVSVEGQGATYYESTSNMLVTLLVTVGAAALAMRTRPPRWVVPLIPLATAALVLSYRRSFYLGVVAAFALIVVVGSGRTGRRLLVPALVVAGIAVYAAVATGFVNQFQGPVGERISSLAPSKLAANREDRYRIDERRNVLADVRASPISGLGLGVPWTAHYPLGVEHDNGRQYTHFAALWFWMKLGILGLIGYLALVVTTIATALAAWRRHEDPWIRIGMLAFAGLVVCVAIAETTATFIGAEQRMSVAFGALVGLVAVARRTARFSTASADDGPR